MKMPGEDRPLSVPVPQSEIERWLRRGTAGRALAVAFVVISYPALLAAAWLFGPLTPASHWFPMLFLASLGGLGALTVAARRIFRVVFGLDPLRTDDEGKRHLIEAVRAAKWPVEVCIDCHEILRPESQGTCPTCRQRFTVMRVADGREFARLDTLLFPERASTNA